MCVNAVAKSCDGAVRALSECTWVPKGTYAQLFRQRFISFRTVKAERFHQTECLNCPCVGFSTGMPKSICIFLRIGRTGKVSGSVCVWPSRTFAWADVCTLAICPPSNLPRRFECSVFRFWLVIVTSHDEHHLNIGHNRATIYRNDTGAAE